MQPSSTSPAEPISWRFAILAGLAWSILAAVFLGVDRFPTWDEAIYWSKAFGGPPTILWLDHRSLGVPALLSPVTLFTESFVVGRLFVVAVLGVVLGAGLRSWSFTQRRSALVGVLFFAFSWPVLFHATEFFPNLPVAVLLWCALGSAWGCIVTKRGDLLALAVASQIAAVVVRPADAVWAGVGVTVVAALDPHLRSSFRPLMSILIGGSVVGLVPWIIESFVLFGGPIERSEGSKELFDGFTMEDPIGAFHSGLADGPTLPDPTSFDLWMVVVWAAAMLGLGLVGAALARRDEAGARLAYGAGLVAGAAYFVFPLIPDPRMLLPSLVMLSIPFGQAVARVVQYAAGVAVVLVCFVIFAGWSVRQGQGVVAQEVEATGDLTALADAIVADADGAVCAVQARYGFPQVELRTGCKSRRTTDLVASTTATGPTAPVEVEYLIWLGIVEPPAGWDAINYGPTLRDWTILRRSS